jgi:hypothetical protein
MDRTVKKEELHRLIEELPEMELHVAHRFLEYLCLWEDPVLRALMGAPYDNEEETPEEMEAVREAWGQLSRGEVSSDDEVWCRLGHEVSDQVGKSL